MVVVGGCGSAEKVRDRVGWRGEMVLLQEEPCHGDVVAANSARVAVLPAHRVLVSVGSLF